MRPEKVTFYVYAENAEEAAALQDALFDFVMYQYRNGTLVTATKIADLLRKYGNNPLISRYL